MSRLIAFRFVCKSQNRWQNVREKHFDIKLAQHHVIRLDQAKNYNISQRLYTGVTLFGVLLRFGTCWFYQYNSGLFYWYWEITWFISSPWKGVDKSYEPIKIYISTTHQNATNAFWVGHTLTINIYSLLKCWDKTLTHLPPVPHMCVSESG